jgi:hypothetical protein
VFFVIVVLIACANKNLLRTTTIRRRPSLQDEIIYYSNFGLIYGSALTQSAIWISKFFVPEFGFSKAADIMLRLCGFIHIVWGFTFGLVVIIHFWKFGHNKKYSKLKRY